MTTVEMEKDDNSLEFDEYQTDKSIRLTDLGGAKTEKLKISHDSGAFSHLTSIENHKSQSVEGQSKQLRRLTQL